jgi:zinc protease
MNIKWIGQWLWIATAMGFGGLSMHSPSFADEHSKAEASAASKSVAQLYAGIRTETLPNGLKVYLRPIPESPTVTVMVAYKVGSCDEDLKSTGLAHYLEHLMFKGTGKIMPGDIDRMTLQNGGANNANTSEDATIYFFDFAADRWEKALDVEADRMRNLKIDHKHEFELEKGAVIQELKRDEDEPWDLESKYLLPLLYGKNNPYGHPVIGEEDQVRGATAETIKGYYDRWYHPNNASLIISGAFDPDQALAKIHKLFDSIPKSTLPTRKIAAPVQRTEPIHKEFPSKFEVPRMVMAFNTIRTGEPGYYGLEVLQSILTTGKMSRLYKKLVEGKEIASSVDSSNSTGRYPGSFMVQVELLKDKNRQEAENLVLEEIKRLAAEPVSEVELAQAKQQIRAGMVFRLENVRNLADSIARGVTTNDLDFLKNYLPQIDQVTAKDVQEVAKKFLNADTRVVVWSVPNKKAGEKTGAPGDKEPKGQGDKEKKRQKNRSRVEEKSSAGNFSLEKAKRVVLDNGLTLLLYENHRLPIVAANAYVRNVRLDEPEQKAGVASLTGMLLDEGTASRSGTEIAQLIEGVGGSLEFSAAGGSVRVLAPDRKLGLELLLDSLANASFPTEAFHRKKQQLLSAIDEAEQQPESKASMEFHAQVYGSHPFGRPSLGRRKSVEPLTPKDCATFHQRLFSPNNIILAVVGDFKSDELVKEITALTAGWKSTPVPKPEPPKVVKPEQFKQKILTMPEAVQLHFYMGEPGIRRGNPDYFKLLVMDYVLGTGPGFTDRLSARLRDREGLAYTVTANVSGSASEEPGVFQCYIGTDPKNFDRVKKEFLEELKRIREEKPKAEEVEDAKRYLLGSLPFRFTTNNAIAGQLLAVERFGLGFDFLEKYRKAVEAVTSEDVQAVAKKYIDPEKLVLVAAGPLDSSGKPLAKSGPEKGQADR